MSTIDPAILAERQRLAQAVSANPSDFASNIKFAQIEAAIYKQDPAAGDLSLVARHLDLSLATLPVTHHPGVVQFVRGLHQEGVPIAAVIKQGAYASLGALLSGQPVPQNGTVPHAAPASSAAPKAAPSSQHAAPPAPAGQRIVVRDIDVGHPSNTKLKEYIDGGKLEELASSYTVLDNFRMRRVLIDKIAENKSQLALACLIRILAQSHDANIVAELVKKIVAYDPAMLQAQLVYEPSEPKLSLAVITAMAAWKTEHVVDPLTEALGDPDPHVRAKAVEGLSEIIEASEEWIAHLVSMLKTENDSNVRAACAKGLQTAGTPDALRALEAAVREGVSDDAVKKVLDAWSSKTKSSSSAQLDKRKAKLAEEKKKEKDKPVKKTGGGIHLDSKAVMMLSVLVVSLIGIGIGIMMYWNSLKPKLQESVPTNTAPRDEDAAATKERLENMMKKFQKNLGTDVPATPAP